MLSEKEAFKAGFLKRCADNGLSPKDTLDLVKQANAELEKISTLSGGLLAALLLGPPALGVGGSALLSKITDVDDTDVEATQKAELAEMYRAQAKRLQGSRRRHVLSN